MAEVDAQSPHVYPSQNDIAPTVGEGENALEKVHALFAASQRGENYVLTPVSSPVSAAGLDLTINGHTAYISGRYVAWGATSFTLAPNQTSFLWVKLVKTGDVVTGVKFQDTTTTTPPSADSMLLWRGTTNASAITSSVDCRKLGGHLHIPRLEVFTASGTFTCKAVRNLIQVWGASGGGGGGGGGGGADGISNGGQHGGIGGAGGPGEYVEYLIDLTPGQQYAITIPAAAAGGTAGTAGMEAGANGGDGGNGADGGNVVIAGLITVLGGQGGRGGKGGLTGVGAHRSALPGVDGNFVATARTDSHRGGVPGGRGGGPGQGATASSGNGNAGEAGASGFPGQVRWWY